MAATTEAQGTLERENSSEVFIIHDDIVGYAKGFQEQYRQAEEKGVKYIRAKVEEVRETGENNLILRLSYPSGKVEDQEVDMLVLSTNLIPNKDNEELAGILDIKVDEQAIFKDVDPIYQPLSATKEGIFLCGTAQGPKDISESIAQACGAASGASELLNKVKDTELVKPPAKKLRDVKPEDEPRIGVILCDCGANIAGFIEMEELREYADSLPNVELVERDLFACGGAKYKDMIADNDVNRTVIVACSPKTHEHLFQLHTENAGLNKYLMEIVNVRNHCSWVHLKNKDDATKKAKTLSRMGVERARLLEPLHTLQSDVVQSCLIIGGGLSGMTCADSLAGMGFEVHLVDKNKELGGKLRNLNGAFMSEQSPSEFIPELVNSVMTNDRIVTHLETNIQDINGFIGQFDIQLLKGDNEKNIQVGSIVVATGAQEMIPKGLYGYGDNKKVLTHMELENSLKTDKLDLIDDTNVVMISCVGAKEQGLDNPNAFCCNIGCGNLLKNAKTITKQKPNTKVFILHKDWTLPHKNAEQERLALGVNERIYFTRYSEENEPKVSDDLKVSVLNADKGAEEIIEADLVVLTTPPKGTDDNVKLKEMLGVNLGPNNFFAGALGKLKPLDFTADGIFLCGTAHSPKGIPETIADGAGAASRVATIISHDV